MIGILHLSCRNGLAVHGLRIESLRDLVDGGAQKRILDVQNLLPVALARPHQLLEGVAEVRVAVEGVLVGEGSLGHQKLVGLVDAGS